MRQFEAIYRQVGCWVGWGHSAALMPETCNKTAQLPALKIFCHPPNNYLAPAPYIP